MYGHIRGRIMLAAALALTGCPDGGGEGPGGEEPTEDMRAPTQADMDDGEAPDDMRAPAEDMEEAPGPDMGLPPAEDMGQGEQAVEVRVDFADGDAGWVAAFTDYTQPVFDSIDFESELRDRPAELGSQGTAYFLSGRNASDDLFMYIKGQIGPDQGLEPGQRYRVRWTRVVIASDVPTGCAGIGGSPGESVYLKGGASAVEPQRAQDPDQPENFILNVDKGNQSQSGDAAVILGTIGNSASCDDGIEAPWERLELDGEVPEPVQAAEDGTLWLFVGTDSGFEGRTSLYYLDLRAELVPVE